jgi:4,5-dihydroxyphthalate decarboxylase
VPDLLELDLACGDYEITRPIIDGVVNPAGTRLNIVKGLDNSVRIWRYLHNGEFDVAEFSCSTYIAARDRGEPLVGLPIFLHRRFRHGFAFVNAAAGIKAPKDLIGRKVGVKTWQVTAILWLRGILESEYGVPYDSIDWYAELDEDVPFEPPPGLRYTRLPHDKSVETMLVEGELDAVLHPDLIKPLRERDPRIARLFPDFKTEEQRYYKKTGIFPIMHLVVVRRPIVEQNPWLPHSLYAAFQTAKSIAMRRMADPAVAPLVWYGNAWEEERALLGPDPWEYGLTPQNRKTLETMIGYSHAHGLIGRKPSVDELFIDPTACPAWKG